MSEHASPAEQGQHAGHAHPNYIAVFGALCVLTVASVVADSVGGAIGKVLVVLIVLSVACLKAMFVMLYFMHLKFEGKWKFALLTPTIVLALAIPAALAPDIAFKYYDAQSPQARALKEPGQHGGATGHGGGAGGPAAAPH
jgi:cytochrome c oxidase subunit 4